MINVFFGNLTVRELKERHNLSITDEEINELEKFRTDNAKVSENTFHIFDKPHCMHAKGEIVKAELIKILGKYSDEFKEYCPVYEMY